jgi:hypothetical protein
VAPGGDGTEHGVISVFGAGEGAMGVSEATGRRRT